MSSNLFFEFDDSKQVTDPVPDELMFSDPVPVELMIYNPVTDPVPV
jgi:hypothetical protein